MNIALITIQIVVSILLIVSIVMQSQGSGLGSAWGGSSESYHTKRGVEKFVFTGTILLLIIFTGVSLVSLVLQ